MIILRPRSVILQYVFTPVCTLLKMRKSFCLSQDSGTLCLHSDTLFCFFQSIPTTVSAISDAVHNGEGTFSNDASHFKLMQSLAALFLSNLVHPGKRSVTDTTIQIENIIPSIDFDGVLHTSRGQILLQPVPLEFAA